MIKPLADRKNPRAINFIGAMYENGEYFEKEDAPKAVEMLRELADRGFSNARYQLAWILVNRSNGNQKDEDEKEAAKLYEACVEENDYAKYYFALMNLLGVGVALDDMKGIALLTELSDKGFESAKSYLDLLHKLKCDRKPFLKPSKSNLYESLLALQRSMLPTDKTEIKIAVRNYVMNHQSGEKESILSLTKARLLETAAEYLNRGNSLEEQNIFMLVELIEGGNQRAKSYMDMIFEHLERHHICFKLYKDFKALSDVFINHMIRTVRQDFLVGKHYDIFAYAKNQDDAIMIGRLIATIFDLLENTEEESGSKALFIESVIKLYKENEHKKSRVSYISLFKTLLGTKAEHRGYHMAQFFYQNWSEEEDGVYYTEDEKWYIKDIIKHTTYPNMNIYNYKKYQFTCRECGWQGLGSKTVVVGDMINCDVIGCPLCGKSIKCVYYPTDNEVLKYGSVKQKADKRRELEERAIRHAEWDAFHKEYPRPGPDELPDIDAKEIIITLREEIHKTTGTQKVDRSLIVISWQDKELWREPMGFEYYDYSYLSIGELLKEKYGDRLIDFECDYTVNLGGDCLSAFDKVRQFRKSLSGRENMSDGEFDYVTHSGHFDGEALFWRALEFAKEQYAKLPNGGTAYIERIDAVTEVLRQHEHVTDYCFTIAALNGIFTHTNVTKGELYDILSGKIISESHYLHGYIMDAMAETKNLTRNASDSDEVYINRVFGYDSLKRLSYRYNGAAYVLLADWIVSLKEYINHKEPDHIAKCCLDNEKYIMNWRGKIGGNGMYDNLFDTLEKYMKEINQCKNIDFSQNKEEF